MRTIEIARKLAELNQKEDAQKAYTLALHELAEQNPEEELEAASYIFFSEGDYQIAFSTFVSLYNRGYFQRELMDLMLQAFYLPNVEGQRKQYNNNREHLLKYPYLFRKDFLEFEELPLLFFPFNDNGYIPFYKAENRFGTYVNFNEPIIHHYFFQDLEKPILAKDIYSQYELEYLTDNVRKSEWVGKENHIYLHYSDWGTFCSYLQCLSLDSLLRDRKQVFLFEDEISQYPVDFKEKFGIDYSKYPPRPVGIREINKLIWHTQLSAHNGGDFFNEIFYGHPNILVVGSIMFDDLLRQVEEVKANLKKVKQSKAPKELRPLLEIKHPSDKDILVAFLLYSKDIQNTIDQNSRIVPALFLQPHFPHMTYEITKDYKTSKTLLYSPEYEQIRTSYLFQGFKYIKTFTPIRRITTSYAAAIRFTTNRGLKEKGRVHKDGMAERLLSRSYLVDPQDRLYQDSILVRFEDGKLNPIATFTALAAFLDVPYTETMTYCSGRKGLNPESMEGNVRGFDPDTVYRTYDEFANDDERAFLEYFFRDVYEAYGYDFQYYHGEPVNEDWIKEKIEHFTCINGYIERSWTKAWREDKKYEKESDETICNIAHSLVKNFDNNRLFIAKLLLDGLYFVNKNGQPLHMMKPLELDPALLEQPLYH